MSRNYDNWEKLVGAVLRREKDRQLAYCESFATSYSTDLSSRFSFDSTVEDADFSFNTFVGAVHLPSAVAEAVVGATVDVLLQNLIAFSVEEIGRIWNFTDDLNSLKDSVATIRDFLEDAEMKQVTDKSVQRWLIKLEAVAFDADYVFDQLNYQLLRKIVQRRTKTNVSSLFSTSNPFASRHKMAGKIKDIKTELKSINREALELGLQVRMVSAPARGARADAHAYLETDSFSMDPVFVGRENDVVKIVLELENLIRRDPAKSAVPGGGLHPITRYVMIYLRAACRSRQTLEQVFEESVDVDYGKGDDSAPASSSSLAAQLGWIMDLLESNLEAKSNVYKDAALSSVFMMNNGWYIVQKVKDSELGALLGDDWIRKNMAKVRQYHMKYQRSSWAKALSFLKVDHVSVAPNAATKTLREKLKMFNTYFDEICKAQSSWVIFDEQLKEEVKISISGNLSPAYRSFIGRLHALADAGKLTNRHIRYSVEDIEARITELFLIDWNTFVADSV